MQHQGYVQYGCGLSAPASWTNFDVSPTLRLQRLPLIGSLITRVRPRFPSHVLYGDIVKGLPIDRASCQAMYYSHVLEHLSLADLRTALRHTHDYLKPGGTFRCVLPELEALARDYLASTQEQPAVHFMEATYLGWHERPRGLLATIKEWLGNSRHLWMWDYRSLAAEVRRASFGDASDLRFHDVEEASRWEGCLGIECRKR